MVNKLRLLLSCFMVLFMINTYGMHTTAKDYEKRDTQVEDDEYIRYMDNRRNIEAEKSEVAEVIEKAKTITRARAIADGAPDNIVKTIVRETTFPTSSPITHHKKSYEQPLPQMPQQMQKLQAHQIYTKQQEVASKFLAVDGSKLQLLHKNVEGKSVAELFNNFKAAYDNNLPITLNITGLSSRARIALLVKIINHKILFLPQAYYRAAKNKKIIEITSNGKWGKDAKKLNSKAYIDDLCPTTFSIGQFNYTLISGPTQDQLGGGFLSGITQGDGSFKEIFDMLDQNKKFLQKFSQSLCEQKENGQPIVKYKEVGNKLFNGFNLLLDYEVARRLVKQDPWEDLPIITYINFILTKLDTKYQEIKDFFSDTKKESDWGINHKYQLKNQSPLDISISLFSGSGYRDQVAKKIIPITHSGVKCGAQIRKELNFLHKNDENSGDEYSGDGKDIIKQSRDKQFAEFIDKHLGAAKQNDDIRVEQDANGLDAFVDQYIDGIKNSDSNNGDVMWGGDIELNAIAEMYDAEINIYQREQHDPIVFNKGGKGKKVNLWLENGHYQVYNPETGQITDVPPDGNCLFHAMNRSGIGKDVQSLRNGVAYYISQTNLLRERIRLLFAQIIGAQNHKQLYNIIDALPQCELLGRAISLSVYARAKKSK